MVEPVELLRRYSNRPLITKPLVNLMELISTEPTAETEQTPLTSADGSGPRTKMPLAKRLTAEDIDALFKSYATGSTMAELAAKHAVSHSTIKRLLREHGARKHRPHKRVA